MIAERFQTYPLPLPDFPAQPVPKERPAKLAERFRWVKSSLFGSRYELRSAGRWVATLTVSGFLHPSGHGEGVEGCWAVEPLERDSGKIVIRANDTFQEVGVFDMRFSSRGGILRTSDGQALVLQSDYWKGCAEFQTPSGEPLIRFRYRGLFRPSADVEILGKGKCLRELPWILMLGWCLIVGYL